MANLVLTPEWVEGIYQLETSDPVMGGADGIDNRQAIQLGKRTEYLKQELEKQVPLDSPNFTGTPTAPNPTDKSADNQIATVKFVKSAVENVQVSEATQDEKGVVSLAQIQENSIPVGAVVGFPESISNPQGYLRADGSTFGAQTYPQLYSALGNKNKLPNIQPKSDVGVTAYFATNAIPDGWIAFDEIATTVTQATYPELYAALVTQYGSISAVPKAEDRFIRNAANGLSVGQVQEDAIRNITGKIVALDNDGTSGAFKFLSTKHPSINGGGGASGNKYEFDASRVVPTSDENRPKSLVLKLCIKAKTGFDGVVYWIKAFGSVINVAELDASRLAQDLLGKADKSHSHTASQITDLTAEVNNIIDAGFTYQKIGDFEIRKYPDGTMIQTCIHRRSQSTFYRGYNDAIDNVTLTYPEAFIEMPVVSVMPHLSHGYSYNNQSTDDTTKTLRANHQKANDGGIGLTNDCSNSKVGFNYQNPNVLVSEMSFHITAVGRWK